MKLISEHSGPGKNPETQEPILRDRVDCLDFLIANQLNPRRQLAARASKYPFVPTFPIARGLPVHTAVGADNPSATEAESPGESYRSLAPAPGEISPGSCQNNHMII